MIKPKHFSIHFLLLLVTILSSPFVIAEQYASINTETQKVNIAPFISWIEDANNEITFEQITKLPDSAFNISDGYSFSKGYTLSSYWLKFDLVFEQDLVNSEWLLEVPFPLLDYIAIYLPNSDNSYSVIDTGDRSPFSQRPIDTTNFVFPVKPQQTHNTFYIHVKTQDSLQVPLILWKPNAFIKHNASSHGLQGLYFGIMIVMVLYNLFIYVSVKERSYLYYIAYISCFIIFQASLEGYTFEYFWPNNTWWANVNIPFFGVLSLFFASLFAREILLTRHVLPKFDKVLIVITLSLFTSLPIVLFGSYEAGIYASITSTFIFFNLVLVAGLLAAVKSNRTAVVFVCAWSVFLLSGVISMLGILDIIPMEYGSQAALQIGSAIEVVLLSIALADRINIIQKEKADIEAESKRILVNANKQLANSNRLKDEFIATISHEIRTPMNGVLGSTQLLLDTHLDHTQKVYVDTINQSGQVLLEILNNILDYSKIEADKLALEHVEFELEDLINECADFFSVISAQNRVKLFVYIHKNTPKVIKSDPLRIKQILLNLLSNAFKYTDRGQVLIRVQMSASKTDQLLIEVEDSGSGLTFEQQSILFQPFVQIDSSSTREKGGTGLGLAICNKLTKLLDGDIGVRSLLGKGATFWFTANVEVIQQHQPVKAIKRSVCIKLDNGYQEQLIKEQLQDWGIAVTTTNLIKYDQELIIITNENHIKEALSLGVSPQNIIIICNQNLDSNEQGQRLYSPISTHKLYSAIEASALGQTKGVLEKNISVKMPSFPTLQVLAVDDNSVNRMIIKKMLKKYQIEADIAVGGIEAVEMIQQHNERYDLILMDIEMPIKDGYETTQDIRAFEKDNNLDPSHIVAVSAHPMKESRGKALISGMDDFLSKPIDQNILIDILKISLSQSKKG